MFRIRQAFCPSAALRLENTTYVTICRSGWKKNKEKGRTCDEHEPFSRDKFGTGTIYLNLNLSDIYLYSSDVKYMRVWETKESISLAKL